MSRRPLSPPWLDHASRALHAELRGDRAQAVEIMNDLNQRWPGQMAQVLVAWIDTAGKALGMNDFQPGINLAFQHATTGSRTANADDVPREVAWTGRLFAARLAGDRDSFAALLEALPDDETASLNCLQVLTSSALIINRSKGARR